MSPKTFIYFLHLKYASGTNIWYLFETHTNTNNFQCAMVWSCYHPSYVWTDNVKWESYVIKYSPDENRHIHVHCHEHRRISEKGNFVLFFCLTLLFLFFSFQMSAYIFCLLMAMYASTNTLEHHPNPFLTYLIAFVCFYHHTSSFVTFNECMFCIPVY